MTQPIQPDRSPLTVSDRDHALSAHADAARQNAVRDQMNPPSPAAAPRDTAEIGQGSALLRAADRRETPSSAIGSPESAAQTAARIAELLRGEPARAMQAYAGLRREDVQALLATA